MGRPGNDIVYDGSTDDSKEASAELCELHPGKLRLIAHGVNRGNAAKTKAHR